MRFVRLLITFIQLRRDVIAYMAAPTHPLESARMIMQGDPEHRAATAHATRLLTARTRVLSLAEQRQLAPQLPTPAAFESALFAPPDLTSLAVYNPALAAALFRTLTPPTASLRASYLSALAGLPATLPTFDVHGRLLRDSSSAIAALVRTEVVGPFINAAIGRAEAEEREGRVGDDQGAQGCSACVSPLNFKCFG
ncbi:hypothetical protein FB451DRAFT_666066 [Mycena latifolia]|nr:hypothetical protein FB451DRAFT_666066 [Mycena latifolia]